MKKTEKKMRVLTIGPYPPPYSGPETSMKMLMESPIALKADLLQINTNYRKDLGSKGKTDFVAFVGLIKLYWKIYISIIKFRPDIIYYYVTATISGWLFKDIWVIFLAMITFKKIVIHMRAGHFRRNYDTAEKWKREIICLACKYCRAGFVQSNNLRNQFEMVMPSEKVFAVYNMIDTSVYNPDNVMDYDPNCYLFLGLLSFSKGYCDLLEIIPEIVKEHPQVKFFFAGYNLPQERNVFFNQLTGEKLAIKSGKESYEQYIHEKYDDNYVYLGPVDQDKKIELLKKCSALILPSYSEGFSMAVLEALSMGKPVICTKVGALGEIVHDGENGFLIEPGDKESLKKAILYVQSNSPTVKRMRMCNHSYVEKNFSKEIISQNIYDLFRKFC